ncbi:MAG: TonB-dependent receptor, partial [Myxococcales bacterium]
RTRGHVSAAKIRFLVRFEPKQPAETPPTARPNAPIETPKAPTDNSLGESKQTQTKTSPRQPLEVIVEAMRPAYTTGVVTRSEAREIPGTFGDPLRAVEVSPGVTPIFSGVPFFFVRGAPPGNVGVFLDGVRVPFLYHAALGPSVVHPALIEKVELHRGASPPQFGRYAGAIINAETRPPLGRAGGEVNVRIFDAGGIVEAPFANGRGHALVGGRYSYTGLIVSLLSDATVQYWDYQTRVDYETSRHGRVGLFAFGAYDRYAAQDQDVERGGGTQFHRLDLRYDTTWGRANTRIGITTGYDRTGSNSGSLKDRSLAFRSVTKHRLSREVSLNYGSDLVIDDYSLEIDRTTAEAPDLLTLFPNRTDLMGSAFAELNYAPARWVTFAPGVRVDGYRVTGKTATAVDPRFAVTFYPNRSIYCSYSIGVANQPPNYVPQVPAATVGTLVGGLQRALSMNTTVGAHLPYDIGASVTGFRAEYYNLLDPIGRAKDWSFDPGNLGHRERGVAYGLEFELRRAMTKRIGGFLSATLSHSERHDKSYDSLSAFDRPLIVSAALGFDLGYRIRAGARLAYYSGIPGQLYDRGGYRFMGSLRSSAYYRADLRLERRWPIPGRGYWALVAEMLNATMSKEITSRKCGTLGCTDEVSGPLAIPSIGFELYTY